MLPNDLKPGRKVFRINANGHIRDTEISQRVLSIPTPGDMVKREGVDTDPRYYPVNEEGLSVSYLFPGGNRPVKAGDPNTPMYESIEDAIEGIKAEYEAYNKSRDSDELEDEDDEDEEIPKKKKPLPRKY